MSGLRRIAQVTKSALRRSPLYYMAYKLVNRGRTSYSCPVCDYTGPFKDQMTSATVMKDSICPNCGSLERHRLQYLCMKNLRESMDFSKMSILHFAPEHCFEDRFRGWFGQYTSADLNRKDVDVNADLCNLEFKDDSFDFVFASHVLEHIKDDELALAEIKRVLKSYGVAVLPVPQVALATIEYPGVYEYGHVRAPGADYFEKYKSYFSQVKILSSSDFDRKYKIYVQEDRSRWPTEEMPLRLPMEGSEHVDRVPICYA